MKTPKTNVQECKMNEPCPTTVNQKTKIKTKKCQPAAIDTQDLIKTVCVNDSGLTRPPKKYQNTNKNKKIKEKTK